MELIAYATFKETRAQRIEGEWKYIALRCLHWEWNGVRDVEGRPWLYEETYYKLEQPLEKY